jgi:hypothetical protein
MEGLVGRWSSCTLTSDRAWYYVTGKKKNELVRYMLSLFIGIAVNAFLIGNKFSVSNSGRWVVNNPV